jgi:hypothetical protein
MLGLVSIAREAVPGKVCSKSVRSHNASNPELVVQLAEAWKRVARTTVRCLPERMRLIADLLRAYNHVDVSK